MRILSIGYEFDLTSVDNEEFSSNTSLFDYDVIIWDPTNLLYEYWYSSSDQTYMGHKALNDDSSVKIIEDINRRKYEMIEMLRLGRTLVIFTSPLEQYYKATGEKKYSGTGRNRDVTRLVTALELSSALPINDVKAIPSSGSNIELRGDEPFKSFWNKIKDFMGYDAYFEKPVGKPLFFVTGTQNVVGSYINIHNGNLLFLPSFSEAAYTSDAKLKRSQKSFIDALGVLIEELKKDTGDFTLPAWSADYLLPRESEYSEELQQLESKLNGLKSKISAQKEVIASLEEHKILFTGTGKALEVQVRRVFEELGFSVEEGAPGRDDLILKLNERVAVVEIKGVSKSAAEKHAAQLEKWASEYYAAQGVEPKGILVVNAFNKIPLKERVEDPFPNQMVRYSTNRNHCLITGLQLLGLYLDFKQNPGIKNSLIDRLFVTDGIFEGYDDWTSMLTFEGKSIASK